MNRMNKKTLLLTLTVLTSMAAFAQRYYSKVFDSVMVDSWIQYGFNFDCNGDSTNLYLDIYKPWGDTAINVPLVVLAHGGSFIQGNRASTDMIALCKELAGRGYTVASIDYRIKISLTSGNTLSKEFAQAVWRGTQDLRAAIRFFRKHIAEGNSLHLDSNNIYTGGVSSGGIMGLHLAFLDTYSEFNTIGLDTAVIGDIEGNSGNPGYSWRVKGVISLSGALGNASWINNNKNVSLCFMHGNNDQTVPYKSAYYKLFGQNVAFLQGGFSMDSAAAKQGMNTRLYTFNGADHVPFVGNAAYMDTTVKYIAGYLYKQVTGLNPPVSIAEQTYNKSGFLLFPNPAKNSVTASFDNPRNEQIRIELFDIKGQLLLTQITNDVSSEINIDYLSEGIYLVRISSQNQSVTQRLRIN